MAFLSRVGNILRHAANRQISSELRSCSSPSIFQAIRCMSSAQSSKLFIGGVSYSTDEPSLREAFSKYGEVVDARIIVDRETGRSRGFGFITYSSVEEASSAIQAMDGQDLHGRRVRVNYANDRTRGYVGGGGFGGYGNAPYGGGYGGASSGGGYGGNVGGGYGGGGYGSGGNYGGSGYGNNYPAPDSNFASGNTYPGGSSGGYGGNSGNFGVAGGDGGSDIDNYGSAPGFGAGGGVGNPESSAGFSGSDNYGSASAGGGSHSFASSGYDGSAVDGSGGKGAGSSFADGFDGSGGLDYSSSGQLDSKESSNVGEDLGGFGESSEGNYRDDDDDTDNFAKRA